MTDPEGYGAPNQPVETNRSGTPILPPVAEPHAAPPTANPGANPSLREPLGATSVGLR